MKQILILLLLQQVKINFLNIIKISYTTTHLKIQFRNKN